MPADIQLGGTGEALLLRRANRHGLITGATGTGKTVTLQTMAEGFSRNGVPVFAADIKGDLSGIALHDRVDAFSKRRAAMGLPAPDDGSEPSFWDLFNPVGFPTMLWDLFGEQGVPMRATVRSMGPLLFSRLLELNEVQEGAVNIAFKVASDEGLTLTSLRDFQTLIGTLAPRSRELVLRYGNLTAASVGTIQRRLLVLETQGAANFFGLPALDINDLLRCDIKGRGYISLLAADRLMNTPRLYGLFLFWLMTELFEKLPEVGDTDKPKIVFIFDEAHLLFNRATRALVEQIERVVRLIRSRGVGIYFVTQSPSDIPGRISAQLGNRIQHALRAFSPMELRGIKVAADTFRPNPMIDMTRAIQELGVGEALISTLQENGEPAVTKRTLIVPPVAHVGPMTIMQRQAVLNASPIKGKYDAPVIPLHIPPKPFAILERLN